MCVKLLLHEFVVVQLVVVSCNGSADFRSGYPCYKVLHCSRDKKCGISDDVGAHTNVSLRVHLCNVCAWFGVKRVLIKLGRNSTLWSNPSIDSKCVHAVANLFNICDCLFDRLCKLEPEHDNRKSSSRCC